MNIQSVCGIARLSRCFDNPLSGQPQSAESEHAIEHQQFVAKLIACHRLRDEVYGQTDDGGGEADVGHAAVVGGPAGEQTVGKESQQWAVGVGTEYVNGVDDTGGVEYSEGEDKEHEHSSRAYMCVPTQSLVIGTLHDVDTETGSECGQCGVGRREGRGYDAQCEQHHDDVAQLACCRKHR